MGRKLLVRRNADRTTTGSGRFAGSLSASTPAAAAWCTPLLSWSLARHNCQLHIMAQRHSRGPTPPSLVTIKDLSRARVTRTDRHTTLHWRCTQAQAKHSEPGSGPHAAHTCTSHVNGFGFLVGWVVWGRLLVIMMATCISAWQGGCQQQYSLSHGGFRGQHLPGKKKGARAHT